MKKFLDNFTVASDKISYFLAYLSMVAIMVMMVMITVDVVLALVFNIRITGAYEISQMILSVVVFSSWAYTQSKQGHIHVVMFVRAMPRGLRFICFGLTSILSTVTMGIATYAVYFQILEKMASNEMTANLLIPHWPFVVFQFLAFLLLGVLLLRDSIKAIAAIGHDELADEVMESWV